MEYIPLSVTGAGITDVTTSIVAKLNEWNGKGLLSGDTLCCVTVATGGAGVIVAEFPPSGIPFPGDYSSMRDLFARPSETFLVRPSSPPSAEVTLLGGRRVYVIAYRYVSTCEIAITLL